MVSVINERMVRDYEARQELAVAVAEMHAKALGGLLAGVAPSPKAGKNVAAAAGRINFLKAFKKKQKSRDLPNVRDVLRVFGVGSDGLTRKN